MPTITIPLLVSSSELSGAINKTSDGAQFENITDEPINIPSEAINCVLYVTSSQVWNVVPNVLTGVNDQFYIEISAVNYVATIPQGLYDLDTLEQAIERDLENQGAPTGTFSFLPDDPTQKVVIRINVADVQIDFTQADTPRDLLGFNSQLLPPGAPSVGIESFLADNEAAFNNIDYFLIHSNLCSEGIMVNGFFDQIICKVDIGDTPPGSLITNQYRIPVKCQCDFLIGASRKRWTVWLTDQDNARVNTQNENFAAQIIIEYEI